MALAIWKREWLLVMRRPGDWCFPVLFFGLVAVLFPMGVSPEINLLKSMGPGVLWVGALMTTLMAVAQLFRRDYELGVMDQWLTSPLDFTGIIAAKCIVQWLMIAVPLLMTLPVVFSLYHLPFDGLVPVAGALALGSVGLVVVGAFGSAITLSLAHANVLLIILILPFYVPILILGAGATHAALMGLNYTGHLAWLAALVLGVALSLLWVMSWAIRIQITESL